VATPSEVDLMTQVSIPSATAERPLIPSDPAHVPTPVVISGLSKRFSETVLAVDNLDLTVEAGQVYGLLGPNGAGKTTVLRMLLGLIWPTSGSVRVFGEPMRPGHSVLRRVGAIVEGPAFVPYWSGQQNLEAFWRAGGGDWSTANSGLALEIAGLGEAIHRKVHTYSKGMQQRLAIAQALLNKPDLLVLDEPTLGLDPHEMREIRELLTTVAGEGTTVLLSSHILAEVEQVCSHAAVMAQGRLIANGTVAQLTGAATTVYLEVDDIDRAMVVIANLEGIGPIAREGPGLSVHLNGVPRKAIVVALVNASVGVETVMSRHHLEDAFLELVGEDQ
jgi:ABC-2 type transport system ATP-binding protein